MCHLVYNEHVLTGHVAIHESDQTYQIWFTHVMVYAGARLPMEAVLL